jgi:type I restriction enzyme S subunit
MSTEWPGTTIGEQLTLQRGFDITKATQQPGAVPVISSGGTNSYHSTAMVKGPGVVLGRKGIVGSVYFVKEDYWPHDTTLWIKDFHGNDELFAYYFFFSKAKDLAQLDVGSANPTLNRNHVHPIRVQFPPLREQKLIGQLLGALDDRITLLRETNATLEAIAQALFKSWFVDFDPVRAKAEGLEPQAMDASTAALFPDSFEESELGLVPKGWQFNSVESFAEKVGMGPFGSNIKVETFVSQGIPVISGQHLRQTLVEDSIFNFITDGHAKKLSNSCVYEGDVIFTHAGSIGQVALLHRHARYDRYVLSQRQFFLRCAHQKMRPEWITYYFRSTQGQHQLLANTSQVGVPSIARPVSYLRSIQVLVPSKELIDKFSDIADAVHQAVLAKRAQIQTLTQLRDTLLPRLISGQLRLPEAEALLEGTL